MRGPAPDPLKLVVEKALLKDPDERYTDMLDFETAINRAVARMTDMAWLMLGSNQRAARWDVATMPYEETS